MTTFNAITNHHADLNSSAGLPFSPTITPDGVGRDLQGSNANDTLFGTEFNDTISGNGGEDFMTGYGGDDYIVSNDPDDGTRAKGDVLFGNDGNDTLLGARGEDALHGNLGDDFADGGAGNDQLSGDQGNDTLQGGAGHDTLRDHEGRNLLLGGAGVDFLDSGLGGSSVLDGGLDNDVLLGDGQDTLLGGAGNDRITIRMRANEALATTVADGGDGNDLFSVAFLNQGSARVSGGAGRDVYLLERDSGPSGYVVTDFAAGPEGDRIDVSRLVAGINLSPDALFSSARAYLKLVQDGADTVLQFDADGAQGTASAFKTVLRLEGVAAGSLAANISTSQISPAGINDGETFIGDERNDTIFGSSLDDRYEGNGGADIILAGEGNDTLLGGAGADGLSGNEGDDLMEGGEGDDNLKGGDGSNTLLGGAGNDWLTVDYAGDSLLDGGDGNDNLTAGSARLTAFGSVRMSGGAGDDYLKISNATSAVTVSASGGSGHDTFVLSLSGSPGITPKATLTDFSVGADSDSLELYLQDLQWNYSGNPFGADGYLRLEQRGAHTVLRYDQDGAAGKMYTMIDVLTLRNVAATSLSSAHFNKGYDPAAAFFGRVLTGTAGADSIQGDARAEHLIGLGGGDTLLGGAGNDLIDGGNSDDTLAGQEGNDSLVGGSGKDILGGGAGDDVLKGDDGDDVLTDIEGNNILAGGYGDDVIVTTGSGSDKVDGGDGDDTITGGAGDTLEGGFGKDNLFATFTGGDKGVVRLVGSMGGDVFTFGPSLALQDVLASGDIYGNMTYAFAPGTHAGQVSIARFQLGYHNDVLDLDGLIPQVVANYTGNPFGALGYLRLLASGNSTQLQFDEDGAAGGAAVFRTILTIDGVTPSQLTANNIAGGMHPNGSEEGIRLSGSGTINGARGNDALDGGSGNDSLDGDAGNDDLSGGDGNDVLRGGVGTDTLNGGNGDDALFAETGDDVLEGAAGNDTLDGGSGSVQLNGGNGNDVLKVAGSGNSGLFGGRGADLIEVAATQQTLAGRVVVSGGEEADTIVVTRGALDNTAVSASGGAGTDTYVLRGEGRLGSLTVKDFAAGAGGDRIDLSGLATPAGLLEFVQNGSATLVRYDADGAAGPLVAATLMTLQNVLATSMSSDNVVDVGVGGAPLELVGVPANAPLMG